MRRFASFCCFAVCLFLSARLYGQEPFSTDSTPALKKPETVYSALALHGVAATGSLLSLNRSWYAEYPRQSFRFTNDWNDWNKMDKLGHLWTAYSLTRLSSATWHWGGLSREKADVAGAISALGYQSLIEVADGFSSHWGFSWSDFAANMVGINLYLSQQLLWKNQRIQVKVMAYKPYPYGSELSARAEELFGNRRIDRLLNDYNIQTYWLSTSLNTLFPENRLPPWLGISVGYGSRLMLGRTVNQWVGGTGHEIDRSDIGRYRRFFLSPDIDLTRIKTKNRLLRSVFLFLNTFKMPAPALEISSNGKIQWHFLLLN
ncbi:DUF2279 domain-containing protein [Larkinella rosea]|uniref:DUF2279 domain-containing protein n=1 Tax=Larkinella rosea TaxID=2025312 RepID=A0A3P1BN82_9BACT|nr:DUF2279 domain-containing protein [Larkinella rosea]RRB02600.1 DUF2279 domain-containing protein [Larkinella rosea]